MMSGQLGRDFDEISLVYDDTRQPLEPEVIGGLVRFLEDHGWSSVLEVGVGTGRIAGPLAERGLMMVGVDASRGMLSRAAAKGVARLVRATAFRLPFVDRVFDVVLFVHVLHMLDDPEAALREAARVARSGVLALMDHDSVEERAEVRSEPSPRDLVRQALADVGYPDLLRPGPRGKEREIVRRHLPAETRTLSDREVTEPLARHLDPLEKRAYRHVLKTPREELARAVGLARAKIGTRLVTYRRSEMVVWWPDPRQDGMSERRAGPVLSARTGGP